MSKVCVTSRSFSKNSILRNELLAIYNNVKFNDAGLELKGDRLVEYLQDFDKAIIALEKIDDELLKQLPHLTVISKYGAGIDNIDLKALEKRKINFGYTPGVNKRSVAELTLSMMLSLFHRSYFANNEIKNNRWKQIQGNQLTDKTVGIIGLGNIGKDLSMLLAPFNVKIIYHDLIDYQQFTKEKNIQKVSLTELLIKSDVITVHVPYNETTRGMIGFEEFKIIPSTSFIINTARGGIIDELALKNALVTNQIRGAAVDVFSVEPYGDTELINHENFFCTPHIGGSAEEAILSMGRAAIMGLDENKIPAG